MLDCRHCSVRQYAAPSHVGQARCVACDRPLGRLKAALPGRRKDTIPPARATYDDDGAVTMSWLSTRVRALAR
jgi:hypothetical protein